MCVRERERETERETERERERERQTDRLTVERALRERELQQRLVGLLGRAEDEDARVEAVGPAGVVRRRQLLALEQLVHVVQHLRTNTRRSVTGHTHAHARTHTQRRFIKFIFVT